MELLTGFYENFLNTRFIFQSYGSAYTGIYLALILSLSALIIYNRKDKEIRGYIYYVIGVLIFLLFPGIMLDASKLLWGEEKSTDLFFLFPTIIAIVLGMVIVCDYIEKEQAKEPQQLDKKRSKNRKDELMIKIFAVTLILVLVEGSVPLQLTLHNFTLPKFSGRINGEAVEIAEIVQNNRVILPSDLHSKVKTYNWEANIVPHYNSDQVEQMIDVFETASTNGIPYVVVIEGNSLGVITTADSEASLYGYVLEKKIGKYLLYTYGE